LSVGLKAEMRARASRPPAGLILKLFLAAFPF